MKTKAWSSLARGLVTTVALGTTVLTDTLARPANAQQTSLHQEEEQEYETFLGSDQPMADSSHESFLDHVTYNDDEAAKPGRVLELDVHVKPRGDVD